MPQRIAAVGGRNVVMLVPVGEFNLNRSPRIAALVEGCKAFFNGAEVEIGDPVPVSDVKHLSRIGLDKQLQLNTGTVLNHLNEVRDRLGDVSRDGVVFVVGFTMIDLYPEDEDGDDNDAWNFVFGIADDEQAVAIFSFARTARAVPVESRTSEEEEEEEWRQQCFGYDSEGAPLLSLPAHSTLELEEQFRSCYKILTHEICHLFGMDHCVFFQCVMNGSNHDEEMRRQPPHLCPICLRKLMAALDITDPVVRYRGLSRFYRRTSGMEHYADWVDLRLSGLGQIDSGAMSTNARAAQRDTNIQHGVGEKHTANVEADRQQGAVAGPDGPHDVEQAARLQARRALSCVDINGDGTLSCEELRFMLCSAGKQNTRKLREDMFQKLWGRLDVNSDGVLTVDELAEYFVKRQAALPAPGS
jgi:archaemetzincin